MFSLECAMVRVKVVKHKLVLKNNRMIVSTSRNPEKQARRALVCKEAERFKIKRPKADLLNAVCKVNQRIDRQWLTED